MKIQTIGESDFKEIDGSRQVIGDQQARKFAALDLGVSLGYYGLSWSSELVDPIVTRSPDGLTIWIGIDQQLAAIKLPTGQICVALTLSTNILQILSVDTFAAVLSETEVLLFNSDFSIRLIKGLPDLARGISIVRSGLVIQLMEGSCLTLDTQTGAILEAIGEHRT
jgi:hypothetical protein